MYYKILKNHNEFAKKEGSPWVIEENGNIDH
jgi:hypothetical protein